MTNQSNHKQILQNMSNQLFTVQEKLTSQEYKDLYDSIMKLNRIGNNDERNFKQLEDQLDEYGNNLDYVAEELSETRELLDEIREDLSNTNMELIISKQDLSNTKEILERSQSHNERNSETISNYAKQLKIYKDNYGMLAYDGILNEYLRI